MNQGKLDVVKQEMARVKIDFLGISELKWTRMVNLIRMTIMSTTVCKNPLEVALIVNKSPKYSTWVRSQR